MVMAIKVSQATIDKIKKMGMTKALKSAPKANAEMTEALRRMYGQRRLDAATKATSTKQPRQGVLPKAVQPRQGVLPKSSAPSAVSGRKVSTSSAKPKANGLPGVTRGGSSQYKSPFGKNGAATRKPVAGKPSVGEQITGLFTGKTKIGPNRTVESVSATMAKRMGISVAEYNRRRAAAEAKYKANKK
jgi:hypothetical protein